MKGARVARGARLSVLCAVLCSGRADAKALAHQALSPSASLARVAGPVSLDGEMRPAPWRWELQTDDGLALNESDLRDKRSNWLRDLLSIGKSRVLARVADRLVGTTIWAGFVAAAYAVQPMLPEAVSDMMQTLIVPTWPHESVGGFLAILLVFRTDQAYERFWEGRQLWASVIGSTRSLSMLALSHYAPGPTRDAILGYATMFPIALRQHLRGRRSVAELERAFNAYAGAHQGSDSLRSPIRCLEVADNLPSTVLTTLSLELGVFLRSTRIEMDGTVDASGQRQSALWAQMQTHVERLTDVIGSCERLKLTPIPLSYSRHTSRFFTLYLLTLPFTLVANCNTLTVPAICIGIGYVLCAMEEIGHVIEEPFATVEESSTASTYFAATPQGAIARAGTNSFLGLVSTFYQTLAMVLGYDPDFLDDPEVYRGVQPLEVLPLNKYCAVIELEIANLAALCVHREMQLRPAPRGGVRLHGAVKGLLARSRAAEAHAGGAWRGMEHDAERYHAIAADAAERLRGMQVAGNSLEVSSVLN